MLEGSEIDGDVDTSGDFVVDDYQHASTNIVYTAVNIPGPGANLDDFDVQFVGGCDCKLGKCHMSNNCACIKKYGEYYDENGKLLESKYNGPIVECNKLCSCVGKGRCGNRVVQFGPRSYLEVFESGSSKGLGLKSRTEIKKGEFICEYAGEIISLEEAKHRSQSSSEQMNYIFVLKEHLSKGEVLKTCVDPSAIGNIGRYINHSCQPNSLIVPVRVDNPIPKLCIFASDDIRINEEITFDYGGGNSNPKTVTSNLRTCFCRSQKCKNVLPYDESLF